MRLLPLQVSPPAWGGAAFNLTVFHRGAADKHSRYMIKRFRLHEHCTTTLSELWFNVNILFPSLWYSTARSGSPQDALHLTLALIAEEGGRACNFLFLLWWKSRVLKKITHLVEFQPVCGEAWVHVRLQNKRVRALSVEYGPRVTEGEAQEFAWKATRTIRGG